MARERQRSKQRQAERRAARLGEGRTSPEEVSPSVGAGDPAPPDRSLHASELAASAPPETTGRSDTVVDSPPPFPDTGTSDEEPLLTGDGNGAGGGASPPGDLDADGSAAGGEPAGGPSTGRIGKVLAFLAAVVAELKRVQWPNRTQLFSLTGVVLGFVLLAGGYLGLLDAIISRIIQALL